MGTTGGSGLTAGKIKFKLGTSLQLSTSSNSAEGDFGLSLEIDQGNAVIDLSDADGFLTSIFPSGRFDTTFDLNATWSADRGFHVTGGAALEIDFPLHLDVGPVQLNSLNLVMQPEGGGLGLETSVAAAVTLGPLGISIDWLGLTSILKFQRGNVGPAVLGFAFNPPKGLGIGIDAGAIAGGGYISFDPDNGRYSGVLDVSIVDTIQVKIVAVLDTILPDGSDGFSLLFVITFDFPPVQLSFGFTLNAVGGIGGVNRTMNIDALRTGFRAHTLDSIMFPPDPINNAPQIVGNIRNFFPPARGRYLFGPMFEFGWGEAHADHDVSRE